MSWINDIVIKMVAEKYPEVDKDQLDKLGRDFENLLMSFESKISITKKASPQVLFSAIQSIKKSLVDNANFKKFDARDLKDLYVASLIHGLKKWDDENDYWLIDFNNMRTKNSLANLEKELLETLKLTNVNLQEENATPIREDEPWVWLEPYLDDKILKEIRHDIAEENMEVENYSTQFSKLYKTRIKNLLDNNKITFDNLIEQTTLIDDLKVLINLASDSEKIDAIKARALKFAEPNWKLSKTDLTKPSTNQVYDEIFKKDDDFRKKYLNLVEQHEKEQKEKSIRDLANEIKTATELPELYELSIILKTNPSLKKGYSEQFDSVYDEFLFNIQINALSLVKRELKNSSQPEPIEFFKQLEQIFSQGDNRAIREYQNFQLQIIEKINKTIDAARHVKPLKELLNVLTRPGFAFLYKSDESVLNELLIKLSNRVTELANTDLGNKKLDQNKAIYKEFFELYKDYTETKASSPLANDYSNKLADFNHTIKISNAMHLSKDIDDALESNQMNEKIPFSDEIKKAKSIYKLIKILETYDSNEQALTSATENTVFMENYEDLGKEISSYLSNQDARETTRKMLVQEILKRLIELEPNKNLENNSTASFDFEHMDTKNKARFFKLPAKNDPIFNAHDSSVDAKFKDLIETVRVKK